VRLGLALLDMAEPYVQFVSPSPGRRLALRGAEEEQHQRAPAPVTPASLTDAFAEGDDGFAWTAVAPGSSALLSWEVGGALTVDEAAVEVFRVVDGEAEVLWSSSSSSPPPSPASAAASPATTTGSTRWSTGAHADRDAEPFWPQFSACARVPRSAADGAALHVRVRVRVDSSWSPPEKDRKRASPAGWYPQSHWVNARTNATWDKSVAGRRVRGRLHWYGYSRRAFVVRAGAARLSECAEEPSSSSGAAAGADADGADVQLKPTPPPQTGSGGSPRTDAEPATQEGDPSAPLLGPLLGLAALMLVSYCIARRTRARPSLSHVRYSRLDVQPPGGGAASGGGDEFGSGKPPGRGWGANAEMRPTAATAAATATSAAQAADADDADDVTQAPRV